MKDLTVEVDLVNQKVLFKTVSDLHPDCPVMMDYVPPVGDGQGFAGLELLLMSLSGCISTAIVGYLRKMGKHIASYKAVVTGIRQENPLSLKKVIFKIYLQSDNTEPAEIDKVLIAASNISPVWLAVKNNVEVVTEYELNAQ